MLVKIKFHVDYLILIHLILIIYLHFTFNDFTKFVLKSLNLKQNFENRFICFKILFFLNISADIFNFVCNNY